jgi:hypothetical protein
MQATYAKSFDTLLTLTGNFGGRSNPVPLGGLNHERNKPLDAPPLAKELSEVTAHVKKFGHLVCGPVP